MSALATAIEAEIISLERRADSIRAAQRVWGERDHLGMELAITLGQTDRLKIFLKGLGEQ